MATNPRIPEHRDVPTLVSQNRKKSSAPWVLFGIFAAAVLLACIIYWLPRVPKASSAPTNAVIPVQPTGAEVRLSDIRLSPSPTGNQLYIYARLSNVAQRPINGVRVNVTFPGANQQPVATITTEVESFKNQTSQSLAAAPIQANETRDVRIPIEHAPSGWNHQMPEIRVQDVTGFGNK